MAAKSSWIKTLKGILLLIFGILALLRPDTTQVILVSYLGIFAVAAGAIILAGTYFISQRTDIPGGWALEGILFILSGILIISNPAFFASVFLIFIGIVAIISGIFQLIAYQKFQGGGRFRSILLLNAIILLTLGLLMIVNPFESRIAVMILFGLYATYYGVTNLVEAYHMRH